MSYPKVYIIILNWNGLKDTLECLESVLKIDYPNFEVIVVDNGSTDNSAQVIKNAYPKIVLIENEKNLGYTGGNNIAMKYAMENGTDYLWLLNNDTIAEQDTLSKLVLTAESDPKIGLISPIVYYYSKPNKIQYCGSYVDWENQIILNPVEETFQIDDGLGNGKNACLWGTALLIKSTVIKKIGYLDDTYFAYWEDMEYSMRTLGAGFKNLICNSARIYHKTPIPQDGPIGKSSHYFYYMIRNRYFFATKYFKRFGRFSFLSKYMAQVLSTIMYCKQSNDFEAADACLDGAWTAMHRKGGPWDKSIRMPRLCRKITYFLFLWHPCFWIDLIRGDFFAIISEVFKRAKTKAMKIRV